MKKKTIFYILGLILSSIVGFYINDLLEHIGKVRNEPVLEIKTDLKTDEVTFSVNIIKGNITAISIDYPVRGIVNNVQDLNSITDARTEIIAIGQTYGIVKNDIELLIDNIKSATVKPTYLQYKVFYTPTYAVLPPELMDFYLNATDKYKISYIWEYNGNKIYHDEWRLILNDKLTKTPNPVFQSFEFTNKAPTPEERTKIRQGIICKSQVPPGQSASIRLS